MRVLRLIVLILFCSFAVRARAGTFSCLANADPERGFKADLKVSMSRLVGDGLISVEEAGETVAKGPIEAASVLAKSNPAQRAAFD